MFPECLIVVTWCWCNINKLTVLALVDASVGLQTFFNEKKVVFTPTFGLVCIYNVYSIAYDFYTYC